MGGGCSSTHSGGTGLLKIPSFKVILVGDPKVGKTSLFLRYYKNQFDYCYKPTKQAVIENVVKKLNVPEDAVVSMTMWDLPGREDMDLRRTYYKDIDAAIVVVDMNDLSSIEMGASWKQDVLNNAVKTKVTKAINRDGQQEEVVIEETPVKADSIPVLLLGNKYDLIEEQMARERLLQQDSSTESEGSIIHSVANTTQMTITSDQESDGNPLVAKETEDRNIDESEEKKDEEQKELTDDSFETKKKEWEKERQPTDGNQNMEDTKDEHPSVTLLHSMAQEHGFISSVMVSAKDSDGSVHAAVQSFVRHLLEKKYADERDVKNNKRKKEVANQKEKKQSKTDFLPLDKVGLKEFDELFAKCNVALKKAEDYTAYYNIALRKFKMACIEANVVPTVHEAKLSLEDCITSLKKSIGDGEQLLVEDEEAFVNLVIEDEESLKLTKPLLRTVKCFNSELAAISKAVMLECPLMDMYLEKVDNKIVTHSEQAWDIMNEAGKNKQDIRQIVKTIDNNRARILRARNQFTAAVDTVDNARQKVTAALVW